MAPLVLLTCLPPPCPASSCSGTEGDGGTPTVTLLSLQAVWVSCNASYHKRPWTHICRAFVKGLSKNLLVVGTLPSPTPTATPQVRRPLGVRDQAVLPVAKPLGVCTVHANCHWPSKAAYFLCLPLCA